MKMSNCTCAQPPHHSNFGARMVRNDGFEPCCHGDYELATPRVVDVGINNLALYAIARPGGEDEVASVKSFIQTHRLGPTCLFL